MHLLHLDYFSYKYLEIYHSYIVIFLPWYWGAIFMVLTGYYDLNVCCYGRPMVNVKKTQNNSISPYITLLQFLQMLLFLIMNINFCGVKWLIVINRIQNKSFCLHNICVCTVYIYYVLCMCMYVYIHNKYTQYTHIYYVNKNLYFGCD